MKKVRKFAQGGSNPNISDDVRQRAAFFAALANDPEAQGKFQKSIHDTQQAAAEKLPPPSPPAPAQRSAPAPSAQRSAPPSPPAVSQDRPNYPTAARVSDSFVPDFAPADAAARLNATTRSMGVSEPKPTRTPTRVLPVSRFEEENAKRVARNKAMVQERKDLEAKAKRSMSEAVEEAKTRGGVAPRSTNISALGERQARQMEEKGSIYSKDFGRPKAERMADRPNYPTAERLREERRKRDEMISRQEREERDTGIAMNKSSADTRRREAEAKRAAEAKRKEDERKREIRRAEVEGNRERDEAREGADRRRKEYESKREASTKAMQFRQEQEEKDTGIGMRKTLLDTRRREAKQDRLNYPTAERLREERSKRDAMISRQEREEKDTGVAMNKNAASVRRKEAVKAMQSRQEQEEKDTGIGMRKTLIDTQRREAKQDRPNYPTERRMIDERRKRILGTDRPRMFKRKDEGKKPKSRGINAANPDNFRSGGMVGSASKRADGIASKGKTRGRIY